MAAAPPPFGIEGINSETYADFRAGRVTEENLTEMKPEELLLANNILILNDKMPVKRPGYTLVKNIGAGPCISIFDFQRDIDQKQFVLFQSGGKLGSIDAQGLTAAQILSAIEDLAARHQYAEGNPFGLYLSNGITKWALYDNGGVNKLYAWGITAPLTAPTVALAAGTNTIEFGNQYAYCYVRKVTDGSGITRLHVGPPSPLSLSTGPYTSMVANVSSFAPPPDATWNFIWIFRTQDTPPDSTAALFFLAEIAVATVTYADSLADAFLDLTRPIPYDNQPPSPGGIVLQFESRMALAGFPNAPNAIQLSGFEEILVGISEEAFPADLFFDIPGGKQGITGGLVWDEIAYLSTLDYWFTVSGYDIETFQKRDKVLQPGAVGKDAICTTPTHIVFLGKDKKLYAWDGTTARPTNMSKAIGKPLLGAMSMEDINQQALSTAQVRWYSFGRYSLILVLVNTGAVPQGQFDWIQVWNASFLANPPIVLPSDGVTNIGLVETDFWPADVLSCSALVDVNKQNYVFFGDPSGNIFRWPDGYLDNGKVYQPSLCTPWSPLHVFIGPMFHPIPPAEVVKRLFWLDIQTDRQDALTAFQAMAVVADTPDMTLVPQNLPLTPFYSSKGLGPVLTAARGNFYQVPGLAIGRWVRTFIVFPADNLPATLLRASISAKPLYGMAP